jgi:hypothetical protein
MVTSTYSPSYLEAEGLRQDSLNPGWPGVRLHLRKKGKKKERGEENRKKFNTIRVPLLFTTNLYHLSIGLSWFVFCTSRKCD